MEPRKAGGSNTYPENDQVDGRLGDDVAGPLVDRVQALQRVGCRRDAACQRKIHFSFMLRTLHPKSQTGEVG